MAKERYGFTGEYNYYVGVLRGDKTLSFVDSIDYSDKSCTWNTDKPALSMNKHNAIQLQMGLMCNGTTALVVEAPDFLDLTNNKPMWNEYYHVSKIAELLEECIGQYNNDYPTVDQMAKYLFEKGCVLFED